MDTSLPQRWNILLRGHFSGITLILLLNWTSYIHTSCWPSPNLVDFLPLSMPFRIKGAKRQEKIETILNKFLSTLNIIKRLKTADLWSTWLVKCTPTQLNLNQAQHVDTVQSVLVTIFDFLAMKEGEMMKTLHQKWVGQHHLSRCVLSTSLEHRPNQTLPTNHLFWKMWGGRCRWLYYLWGHP